MESQCGCHAIPSLCRYLRVLTPVETSSQLVDMYGIIRSLRLNALVSSRHDVIELSTRCVPNVERSFTLVEMSVVMLSCFMT
jgi:hypothetical protein